MQKREALPLFFEMYKTCGKLRLNGKKLRDYTIFPSV